MPNAYAIITQQILSQLEAGTVPWRQPWQSPGVPKSPHPASVSWHERLVTGVCPYASPYWLTYRQAQEIGGG